MLKKQAKYGMIGKCLYFPVEKLIVVGDLHLGYDQMMEEKGLQLPLHQLKQTTNELKEIFGYLKLSGKKFEKIIFLGDIKHFFKYNKEEKMEIYGLLDFLRKYVGDKNIIFIKGNHDKMNIGKKFIDFYIENDIIFLHGDREFKEMNDKNIKLIIMGHDHPGVWLKDNQDVKKEKYKCFLEGRFKRKKLIMMPSFFGFFEGGDFKKYHKDFSMIPREKLENFNVFVVSDNLKEGALGFGKLKNFD